MTRMKLMIAVSMMLMVITTNAQAEDYKLVKKEGLLSLYEKWVTAMNGEKAREIKAVFYAHAKPADAVALLKDQSKALEWNPNAGEYKVVVSANPNSWLNYVIYDIPWPVGDQDLCLQYSMKQSGTVTEVVFQGTDHKSFPVKSGVGRISGTKGKWVFEQQTNGLMKITYTISTNRNSKLPKFITDPIIHDNMMESMVLFTSLLENK